MTEQRTVQPPVTKKLLILNIAPELKEDLIDYLLGFTDIEGFTSYSVRGHGDHNNLSVAEQVSGRRKREQYEILLDESIVENVLAGLANEVGKGIVYWEHAISNFGRID